MCLGLPARIVEVFTRDSVPCAVADVAGVRRTVCLAYAKEAGPGAYVVVHSGFAIAVVSAEQAARSYALLGVSIDADASHTAGAAEAQAAFR
jgi:hydrogenase expression/formation protein HypC